MKSLSNFAAFALVGAFILYTAMRGTLPRYVQLLVYNPPQDEGKAPAQQVEPRRSFRDWLSPFLPNIPEMPKLPFVGDLFGGQK